MRIDKSTYEDVAAYLAHKDTVLIPVGAVECYGPHLATGTELALCSAWADAVASRSGLAVTPIVPFNYSHMFLDYAGTCSIDMATIESLLLQACSGLAAQGFRRFLFVNIHAGSIGPIESVCRALRTRFGAFGGMIDIFSVMRDTADVTYATTRAPTGHGGEMVTSVAMHVCPDLVFADRMRAPAPFATFAEGVRTVTSGRVAFGRSHYQVFSNISDYAAIGIQGDPTGATAEKGRQIWENSLSYGTEAAGSFAGVTLRSQRRD